MFKYEPTFCLESFKRVVEQIQEHRVCLVTGAEVYGTFIYGGMYGSFGLERAGLPDTIELNDKLADELAELINALQLDVKEFMGWLDFLKIDDKVKETTKNWFINQFPLLADKPENRNISERLLADLRYILETTPSGNEKKIIQQIYDFVNLAYKTAPFVTYALHNFMSEDDWAYLTPTLDEKSACIPKGGRVIKLLTCVLPQTQRALNMTNYVLNPEAGMLFIGAMLDANEGEVILYYDREGNIIEKKLLRVIVDSIFA